MKRMIVALAGVALIATAVLAGPGKGPAPKAKGAAAVPPCAECPAAKATAPKCAECPTGMAAKAKCAECPGVKSADCKPGQCLVKVKCGTGTKTADVTKLTAQKKYGDYAGKRYFFVCNSCSTEFKKDPAGYAKRHTGFKVAKNGTVSPVR